jgi:hypothetical protein
VWAIQVPRPLVFGIPFACRAARRGERQR